MHCRVEQVHVPAPPVAEAAFPAEYLGGHLVHVHAVRDRHVVRPVRSGDGIITAQVSTDARGDWLLPGRQVHLTGDQPGPDVECRFLVRVVLPQHRLLERAAQHHHAVQVKPGFVVHCASSVLSSVFLRGRTARRVPGALSVSLCQQPLLPAGLGCGGGPECQRAVPFRRLRQYQAPGGRHGHAGDEFAERKHRAPPGI